MTELALRCAVFCDLKYTKFAGIFKSMGENCIYLNILAKKDKYIDIWENTMGA